MKKITALVLVLFSALLFFLGCDTGSGSSSSPASYSVTYDGNSYQSGSTVTVLDNTGGLAKAEYTFEGWNSESDGSGTAVIAGNQFSISGNVTLYAQWELEPTSTITTRTFRALNAVDNTFYDCKADLYSEGTYCQIYVERTSSVSIATANAIAGEFDSEIYPKITTNFGNVSSVDDNSGKIILLYLDIQDGFSGSGGYIGGYFHSINEYNTATYPDSNEADMIFLDTYPSTAGSSDSNETVAHELQHLINYNVNMLIGGSTQETWINEGLSSAAEYVYSGAVSTSRVDYYNADPQLSSNPGASIAYGNNFFIWQNSLEDYATVSLFFQWLRIHDAAGTGIYKEIMDSSYRDYRAVTSSTASWTDTAYSDFADWGDLLSTWMMANILGESSGYLGYENEVTDQYGNPPAARKFYSSENATYETMYPGMRVISDMPAGGTNTPPAGGDNIKYAGVSSNGTIDRTSPYTGDFSLVYNSNPSISGGEETGYVAKTDAPEPERNLSYPSLPLPDVYKIDLPFNEDGSAGKIKD